MQLDTQKYLERFKSREGPKIVNERQELIQRAVDAINAQRKGTKWKPVTWAQINGKCSHLKGFELSWFVKECDKAKNFSSYFFYKLKIKK